VNTNSMIEDVLPVDEQASVIQDVLTRLASGDFTARGFTTDTGDAFDQILHSTNQLAVMLEQQHAATAEAEQRAGELLDVMMQMAIGDYTKRVPTHDGDTVFDALATGLNMLSDELVAAQAERIRLQDEIIQTQAAVIEELSTPLIPINNDILVMPLIGSIDSTRAQHVLERVLAGVATNHARIVILDITGVAIVDTQVANTLVRASQAVQLLGSQVMLTGIRPEVAQTLVNLGIELRGLLTWSTLQMGIAHAMRNLSR
jgi:anti-anti-sigma regulatory factor